MIQKITLSIVAGLIIGLSGSYALYHGNDSPGQTSLIATSTVGSTTATSTNKKKKIITVGGATFETDADNPAGITLEEVPTSAVPWPIPTLNAAVTVTATANVSADAQKIIRTQVAGLVKKLTANPGVADDWISLGQYRKMAGEYTLARDAWEYAKKLQPRDKLVYNNLGDLYQYYLKNYNLAETNWKKTIELDPTFIAGYRGLYDLYTQNKQVSKAKVILETGLAKNPHSIDLLVLLANYYKEQGDKVQAKSYFVKALAEAKVIKENASMIPVLQAEIDTLK